MESMERLWTVKDVMSVLPIGKTACVALINSLPHINTGRKLMIEPRFIRSWIEKNTSIGKRNNEAHKPMPKEVRKKRGEEYELTKDGIIPYRHTRKTG